MNFVTLLLMPARCMKLLHINDHNYDSLYRIHLFILMNTLFCREQETSAQNSLQKQSGRRRERGQFMHSPKFSVCGYIDCKITIFFYREVQCVFQIASETN